MLQQAEPAKPAEKPFALEIMGHLNSCKTEHSINNTELGLTQACFFTYMA